MVSYLLIELFYIGMSLEWANSRTGVRSRDYQNFWDGWITKFSWVWGSAIKVLLTIVQVMSLCKGSTDTEKKRRVLPQVPGRKEVIIGKFIIWLNPRAGNMKRFLCSDWLPERP